MTAVNLAPLPIPELFIAGSPATAGRLFVYQAGTTTKITTYTDEGGLTAQTNPIVLNSRGEPENTMGASVGIWIPQGTNYKLVFANPGSDDPPTSPIWTIDNIQNAAPGTVSSVGLVAVTGSGLAVTGSPVTGSGNLGIGWGTGGATINEGVATPLVAVAFSATAMTINLALSNIFATNTLTANVTVAPSITNPIQGQTFNWLLFQDATGGRTMTWPTNFLWVGGSPGVLSTAANARDILIATYTGGFFYCSLLKGFA